MAVNLLQIEAPRTPVVLDSFDVLENLGVHFAVVGVAREDFAGAGLEQVLAPLWRKI